MDPDQTRRGYLYGIGAYTLWGFFPAYFKLLRPAGAIEILAHRIVWSAIFMIGVLTAMRRWRQIRHPIRNPRTLGGIAAAACLIGINWGTYIYAVNSDHVVESSLGYFINPLVVILLGVLVLGERLRPAQWVAVGVGGIAVGVLTAGYGRPPWIALTLALSFGMYGLTKKQLRLPAADGLLVESATLALPALAVLIWLGTTGQGSYGTYGVWHALLLTAAGAVTAIPLLMFAGAANRIPMVGLGMLQYLAPILQLALGVFAFGEPMPPQRLAGFALVWLALAVFTWDALASYRRGQRRRLTQPAADRAGAGTSRVAALAVPVPAPTDPQPAASSPPRTAG